MLHNPEYRLKARSSQDRSVKHKNYARTTDKGFPSGRIYSLVLCNNLNETQVDRQDYQLVTITNLLIEQTKTNAGAFVDEMKRQMDGGIKNLSNNMAFELFGSGTATRGVIGSAITNPSPGVYQFTLQNPQNVVNFEVNMTIQASATDGGAPINANTDLGLVSKVNRATGVIQFTVVSGAPNANWANGNYLTVQGDIPAAGGSGSGPLGSVGSYLAASGMSAWLPATDPASNDSFWGVNRSVDPTRLAGLRFDASAYSIEEGMVSALGFANREGADPDTIVLSFQSYSALENALGAKVQYVDIKHTEADISFEGIRFHSAYGYLTVFADRSMIPQTAFCLSMDTWKLRSLGKAPHILTYGLEGLEGSTSLGLVKFSLIDLEARQGNKGQAKLAA